jgi:RNA polymerase sigma-70 factor (ECF subfamily)
MHKAIRNDAQDIVKQGPDPGRWLQEYGDALFRYALRRLHNAAHAEDVVQETLLAAFQARTSYSGRASEKTWLTGILKHKIIDFIRKQVRELTVNDINALSDAAGNSSSDELFDARGHWLHPPQDWGDPDKALQNHQFIEIFAHCLERQQPAHAQIFSLKELAGQSIDEICKELDITATNCSVMLYRARMGLRRCLEIRWAGNNQEELH